MCKMKKYWLVVNPDVFIWKKGTSVFVYNSDDFGILEFETFEKFDQLYELLINPENLYVVELTEEDVNDNDLRNVINSLIETKCIELISQTENLEPPVSFCPFPGVQRSREKFRKRPEMVAFENYMIYLHELTIYVNGTGLCDNRYAKQFPYFLDKGEDLDYTSLSIFLKYINNSSISNIRICGYNIFQYPHLNKLLDALDRIRAMKSLYVSCSQLEDFQEKYRLALAEQFEYVIVVDREHPIRESVVADVLEKQLHVKWSFYVSSNDEYNVVLEQIEQYHLDKYNVKPVFTGDNLDFFSEFVFLTEEDIRNTCLNKRQIFANQIINVNDFGKFTISPQGAVFVNINFPSCGNISKDSIYSLIRNELVNGDLWFRTRSEQPCVDCKYQWLCPSPSNYELVLNKQNLCYKE